MNKNRRHIIFLASVAPFAFALHGCSSESSGNQPSMPATQPGARTLVSADGYRGFWREGVAAKMSLSEIQNGKWMMVFFDPMCPHCLTLWETAHELKIPQLWVPVNVLRRNQGEAIGAWLLETKTPEDDFESIKSALMNAQPFEVYPSVEQKKWIGENTQRFAETGQRGVPTLVAFHPEREPRVIKGTLPKEDLIKITGE